MATINIITGAGLIHAVNLNVLGFIGITILTVCTLAVTLLGCNIVHKNKFRFWVPVLIVFIVVVIGTFAYSGAFQNVPSGNGRAGLGSVLPLGSVIYASAMERAAFVIDFIVYQGPQTLPGPRYSWRPFWAPLPLGFW